MIDHGAFIQDTSKSPLLKWLNPGTIELYIPIANPGNKLSDKVLAWKDNAAAARYFFAINKI